MLLFGGDSSSAPASVLLKSGTDTAVSLFFRATSKESGYHKKKSGDSAVAGSSKHPRWCSAGASSPVTLFTVCVLRHQAYHAVYITEIGLLVGVVCDLPAGPFFLSSERNSRRGSTCSLSTAAVGSPNRRYAWSNRSRPSPRPRGRILISGSVASHLNRCTQRWRVCATPPVRRGFSKTLRYGDSISVPASGSSFVVPRTGMHRTNARYGSLLCSAVDEGHSTQGYGVSAVFPCWPADLQPKRPSSSKTSPLD